ncbi:hypothetical protein [Gabonibacter chumensis]|uniref:hypothetical protein n=1 Tax=Gabonibacter chumensis TaxID=2972474 RepID=UPI0025737303|nr:hypothetical protein [Gabonibacter chumensis]MCR9011627.1 hypothetical protein [Gabonibacter chumensis]
MKINKLLIIFILIVLGITNLNAQTLYISGSTVESKDVTYSCIFVNNRTLIKIFNINYRDSTWLSYYNDRRMVDEDDDFVYRLGHDRSDLYKACREMFTSSELDI